MTQIDDQVVLADAAGNLTQDRADRQLTYDEQNRLSSVKNGDLTLAVFRYNALGQRTQKITPQGITTFLYGPDGQLLGETLFDIEGKKLTSQYYVWLDGLPLGGVSVNHDAKGALANSTPFYLHSDHLNTPRIATNASQHTVWHWKADAFGVGEASGSLTLNLRFPGQYYDVESDPIGLAGGLNTFGYVEGNPLSYSDNYGLKVFFDDSAYGIENLKRDYERLKGTPHGAKTCKQLEDLPDTYTITTVNSFNSAWYEGKTRTIRIDPSFKPIIQTTSGPMPADSTTILGHEIGHAATKTWDNGPGNMNNVNANENPIRNQLGLPSRTSYP
ncbi:RHS repeat domain-containing protein [Pseudomonas sp. H11T01]|uniref:RHS repeat domain-containing protein n=1 Tax=Pseudomonas sp. H11T01 TaxID=3402749 RepID=UPI003ACD32A7